MAEVAIGVRYPRLSRQSSNRSDSVVVRILVTKIGMPTAKND
jgi:hypothetical protein